MVPSVDTLLARPVSRRSFLAVTAGLAASFALASVPTAALARDWSRWTETFRGRASHVGVDGGLYMVDPLLSIYCGGNATMAVWESEGATCVVGDLRVERAIKYHDWFDGPTLVGGIVTWGLDATPGPDATMLSVGGSISTDGIAVPYVSGNAKVGGSASDLTIATTSNGGAGWDRDTGGSIQSGIGRAEALRMVQGSSGKVVDMSTFSSTLATEAGRLDGLATTGTWSVTPSTAQYDRLIVDNGSSQQYVTTDNECVLHLVGDGADHEQVFDIDDAAFQAARGSCGNVSLDIAGCPGAEPIVVNWHGASPSFQAGFTARLDGTDVSIVSNMHGSRKATVKELCARLLWNFADARSVTMPMSHIQRMYWVGNGQDPAGPEYGIVGSWYGSILVPHGSLHAEAYTNGRVLVAGDLYLRGVEHHNVVWAGDPVYEATVKARTSVASAPDLETGIGSASDTVELSWERELDDTYVPSATATIVVTLVNGTTNASSSRTLTRELARGSHTVQLDSGSFSAEDMGGRGGVWPDGSYHFDVAVTGVLIDGSESSPYHLISGSVAEGRTQTAECFTVHKVGRAALVKSVRSPWLPQRR